MIETTSDPWAEFDAHVGTEIVDVLPASGRFAFYGRCSTEDNQDPETSRQWQLRAAESLIGPAGGKVVASYFDIGFSRSLPWRRRPEALRLLTEMSSPNREWDAIVVGEGQRCWFGSQFSEVAPLVEHSGVSLWVPELGGEYDPRNSSHYILMTVNGGMSRGERQRVQERVYLGMAAQVENQGRFQGGRAPYGYLAVPVGPHPNPRKAAEGFQLKRLAPNTDTAPVVSRIFQEYLEGRSIREIASRLNFEGVLCPSAADPGRNRHRLQDGWQISTISTILSNGRYTGYEFWGRFKKEEVLIDATDVSLGYQTRLARSDKPLVRSRCVSHDAIISVETFVSAQLRRREAKRLSMRQLGATPKRAKAAKTVAKVPSSLRGFVRCTQCGRRMEISRSHGTAWLRCRARDLTPGTKAATRHPSNISVPEAAFVDSLSKTMAALFSPANREQTFADLESAGQPTAFERARYERAKEQLADATARLNRLYAALEDGEISVDRLKPRIVALDAEIERLEAEMQDASGSVPRAHDALDMRAAIESLGDLAVSVFQTAEPSSLHWFFTAIGLRLQYDHTQRAAQGSIEIPGQPIEVASAGLANAKIPTESSDESSVGISVRVRGGT